MRCGNCGADNPEGAVYCAFCGKPLEAAEPPAEVSPEPPAETVPEIPAEAFPESPEEAPPAPFAPEVPVRHGKAELIRDRAAILGALIAAVALAAVLLWAVFGGRSDVSTLKKYVRAACDMDAEAIVKLMPKVYIQAYADREGIGRRDAREELEEELEETLERYDERFDGVDFDEVKGLKVEIRDEDRYSKKQVRAYNESFEEMYDRELKAREIKEVEIRVSGRYDGERFDFKVEGILIVKLGRAWYLLGSDPGALYSGLAACVE